MTDITSQNQTFNNLNLPLIDEEIKKYLCTISHDLKIPLISIEGNLNRLEKEIKEELSPSASECMNFIKQSVTRMERMVDDLNHLAEIGKFDYELTIVEVLPLIDEIIRELHYIVDSKKIKFVINKNLPSIKCNRNWIYRIFSNLIGNAIKFSSNTNNPVISIGYNNGEFYIKDNGLGIDPSYHDDIFKLFTRINANSIEGSGIGLTAVKKFLDVIGGSIRVESMLGEGATFYIKFPHVEYNSVNRNFENDNNNQANFRRSLTVKNKAITNKINE
ncbi:MAG: hypothetical protein GY855_09035 [candidate division Zixibacteria bacterium]|nr:hypothetical protein [candidate division Zixibacteria bacterium]